MATPRLVRHRSMTPERGQASVLIVGFAVVVILLVAVVTAASAAFLQRRSLMAWADGAALTAAQSLAEERLYTYGAGAGLPLSMEVAQESVTAYVMRHRLPERFTGFAVASVRVDDQQQTITVTFRAVVDLPFGNVFGIVPEGSQPIEATASASAPIAG